MKQIAHFGARPAVRQIARARVLRMEPAAPVLAIAKRQKFVASRFTFWKSAEVEFVIEQSILQGIGDALGA